MIVRVLGLALITGLAAATARASNAETPTIYPVDRAAILAGARFDFKVEFPGTIDAAKARVTVNGMPYEAVLEGRGEFVASEGDGLGSAIVLRDATLREPGTYVVDASDGTGRRRVEWSVFDTPGPRTARNVIVLIGDGMSMAHRTAARILSKGLVAGKYRGKLAMDTMPRMALIGTAGYDSIVSDSANSATAYFTGHKTSVRALGVYADRTPDPFDDPRVETLGSLVRRVHGMAIGIVTDAYITDATPASPVAHTRDRRTKDVIPGMFLDLGVDVLLGGGSAYFHPASHPGSRRLDERDLVAEFRARGYDTAATASEMAARVADPKVRRLLGLFHPSNLDGVLDRKFLGKGTVPAYPDQPDLVDMTRSALEILGRHEDGFLLLIEAAQIDKYSHYMDWERAVMDTILFDQAVGVAREFAERDGSTLVLVTSDHGHAVSVVGTVDDRGEGEAGRERLRVADNAGFPDYEDADGDGYPDSMDVPRRLAVLFSAYPSHFETFRPRARSKVPLVVRDEGTGTYVVNPAGRDAPDAIFRPGILPPGEVEAVHSAHDVILTAMGPGSERVAGFLDGTEVFEVIARALALGSKSAGH